MCTRPRTGPRATVCFTLVELLVALSLLTFGLVGVLSAYAKAADDLRRVQDMIEATSLLKREMGQLQVDNLRYAGLPLGVQEGDFGAEAPNFTWRLEIDPADVAGLLRVSYRITHKRTGRTVTLDTLLPVLGKNPPG